MASTRIKRAIRPCIVVGDDCFVPLTQGQMAIVDASDHDLVMRHNWHADKINEAGFYVARRLPGRKIEYLHRLLAGAENGLQVDHIDGDTLNNRRSNLRACTARQNQRNRKPWSRGTSKFKGVSWSTSGRKWRAGIKVGTKSRSLGRFTNELEAARAYDRAASEHFGEFAWLNFPLDVRVA